MITTRLLRSVPLFAELSDGQLITLEDCVERRKLARGALVLRQGEPTDGLYVMLSGRVKVLMTNEHGQDVILAHIGVHEFFGELGLIDTQRGFHNVETLETCEILFISRADFARCLAHDIGIVMRIAGTLARRLDAAYRRIESLALLDVQGRVASVLLESAEQIDGKRVIRRPLRKVTIAQMIGASREMVSRVMKDFEKSGYIRFENRSIELSDRLGIHARPGHERIGARQAVLAAAPQVGAPVL